MHKKRCTFGFGGRKIDQKSIPLIFKNLVKHLSPIFSTTPEGEGAGLGTVVNNVIILVKNTKNHIKI
jgi:hypothetical protein